MVAGEESGDLHGAHLIRNLKEIIPNLQVYGVGGDRMQEEGMELYYHHRNFAVVGLSEVIKNLPRLWRVMVKMEEIIRSRRPDVVVLIDYPGFNIRLAQRAHRLKTKVFYYIAPQVWAWGKKRIPRIVSFVDHMAVIFPFEAELFRETTLPVTFVGNPLLDIVRPQFSKDEFYQKYNLRKDQPLIGLLPGSRWQEVKRLFPVMLDSLDYIKQNIPTVQVVVGVTQSLGKERYVPFLPVSNSPLLIESAVYDIMANADLLLIASGTATLEAAILQCPMIILYKMSFITYGIARRMVKIPKVGLANVVAGKEIVPEYIQKGLDPARIALESVDIIMNEARNHTLRSDLRAVRDSLGEPGAARRTAELIVEMMKDTKLLNC